MQGSSRVLSVSLGTATNISGGANKTAENVKKNRIFYKTVKQHGLNTQVCFWLKLMIEDMGLKDHSQNFMLQTSFKTTVSKVEH